MEEDLIEHTEYLAMVILQAVHEDGGHTVLDILSHLEQLADTENYCVTHMSSIERNMN